MAYKYRLRPTAEQRVLLGKIAAHNRFVWNKAVALNKERYAKGEKRLSGYDLSNLLPGWKKNQTSRSSRKARRSHINRPSMTSSEPTRTGLTPSNRTSGSRSLGPRGAPGIASGFP